MMKNAHLSQAKTAKNDEFYTQLPDIEKEVLAYLDYDPNVFKGKTILLPCDDPEWSNFTKFFALNFQRFGLKKLISTSYVKPNLFSKENTGKVFTLTRDISRDGRINFDDLEWELLKGDGDFRSDEVSRLRDEADIIVTNPPFSLFREFLAWIVDADKKCLIIGNINAITYKEVFPLIKENRLWSGTRPWGGGMWFVTPNGESANVTSTWFTNLEHGRRHTPLQLMSKKDVERYWIKGKFETYDNYDAIEVPKTKWIPSDYKGVMGVPISWLDKYCPEQFEIVGMCENEDIYRLKTYRYTKEECKKAYLNKFGKAGTYDLNSNGVITRNGLQEKVYQRILIRHLNPTQTP